MGFVIKSFKIYNGGSWIVLNSATGCGENRFCYSLEPIVLKDFFSALPNGELVKIQSVSWKEKKPKNSEKCYLVTFETEKCFVHFDDCFSESVLFDFTAAYVTKKDIIPEFYKKPEEAEQNIVKSEKPEVTSKEPEVKTEEPEVKTEEPEVKTGFAEKVCQMISGHLVSCCSDKKTHDVSKLKKYLEIGVCSNSNFQSDVENQFLDLIKKNLIAEEDTVTIEKCVEYGNILFSKIQK